MSINLILLTLFFVTIPCLILVILSQMAHRRTQGQLTRVSEQMSLLLRTGLYNTKQANRIGDTSSAALETAQKTLSLHQKVTDRQRVLLEALSRQTIEISSMLETRLDKNDTYHVAGNDPAAFEQMGDNIHALPSSNLRNGFVKPDKNAAQSSVRLAQIIGPDGKKSVSKTIALGALLTSADQTPNQSDNQSSAGMQSASYSQGQSGQSAPSVHPSVHENQGESRIMMQQFFTDEDDEEGFSSNGRSFEETHSQKESALYSLGSHSLRRIANG